jgi:putative redox protein
MEHVTRSVIREAGSSKFCNAVETEGHSFVMDEPEFMGGTDLGPAPFGLVASALGACTNMTLRMYAGMKKLPLDEVDTEITHTPSKDGHHFQRIIKLTGNLTEEQRQRLLEIANKCPVHKLLVSGGSVWSELSGEAA